MSELQWIDATKELPKETGEYLCLAITPEVEDIDEDGKAIIKWRQTRRITTFLVYTSDNSVHAAIGSKTRIVAWAEIPEVPEDILKNNGGVPV